MTENTISIEKVDIRSTTAKQIVDLPLGYPDPSFMPVEYKLEIMVHIIEKMLEQTKRELIDYFSVEEALLLVWVYAGRLPIYHPDPMADLLEGLVYAIESDEMDQYFNVDREQIIKKVRGLSVFQSLCIGNMSYQYLSNFGKHCFTYAEIIIDERLIKEIFGITH